jgi:signal transduction histidine kinase
VFNIIAGDVGRPIAHLTHRLLDIDLVRAATHVIQTSAPAELEVRSIDGQRYLARLHPYRSVEDRIDGAVLTFLNVTQIKRTEEMLLEREAVLHLVERELRAADRRKDEFLATLAHELRNPLTPVRTALDLLRRGATDPALVRRVCDTMGTQVDQLVRLINDLMDVARINEGRIELQMENVSVSIAVQSALDALAPVLERARHTLDVSLPAEELVVRADPTRVIQILTNLVHNAVKYTPPGGNIVISASLLDDE